VWGALQAFTEPLVSLSSTGPSRCGNTLAYVNIIQSIPQNCCVPRGNSISQQTLDDWEIPTSVSYIVPNTKWTEFRLNHSRPSSSIGHINAQFSLSVFLLRWCSMLIRDVVWHRRVSIRTQVRRPITYHHHPRYQHAVNPFFRRTGCYILLCSFGGIAPDLRSGKPQIHSNWQDYFELIIRS
jgi:hypothetical protein